MKDDDSKKPLEAVGDEALEARITAWVLGEASAFEASELEALCKKDPEAALFARRVRMLDGLIRDEAEEPWKLPDEKRAKVLGLFEEDVVRLEAPGRSRSRWRRVILPIAAVLVLAVVIGGMMSPMGMRRAKTLMERAEIVSYSAAAGGEVDYPTEYEPVEVPISGASGEQLRRQVVEKPAAPASSMARVIASNTTEPQAVPVPEVDEAQASVAFGNGDDFGVGWGSDRSSQSAVEGLELTQQVEDSGADGGSYFFRNRSGDGGGESPVMGDVPTLGRLFEQTRGERAAGGGEALDFDEGAGLAGLDSETVSPTGEVGFERNGEAAEDPFAPMDRLAEVEPGNGPSLADRENGGRGVVPEPDERDSRSRNLWADSVQGGLTNDLSLGLEPEGEVDPVRSNAALSEEHGENVAEVWQKLYMGRGHEDLGQLGEAKQSYEDALRADPNNEAARRGLERLAVTESSYYRAAYDETRSELLAEVDESWEMEGGYTDARQAQDAATKFALLETEAIELESQIDTLLRYDGDQLTTYAAGLNFPDNTVKNVHPEWLQAKRELEAAQQQGLGEDHPTVSDARKKVAALDDKIEEGQAALRESLRAQLEMVKEQKERLGERVVDEEDAMTSGIARHSFDDAKGDFEAAQGLLEKLKVKLVSEEMQRRISEDPVVVHEEATVEGPGFLAFDRRSRGRAVVQVRPSAPSVEVLSGMVTRDAEAGSPTFFPTEFEVVKSRKTLERAIELGELERKTGKSKEELVEALEKGLEVENRRGTDLIEVRYRHRDEALTEDVVDSVVKAYGERRSKLEKERSNKALEELREAVRSQEELVEEKRKVLTQLVRNNGVVYVPGAATQAESPPAKPEAELREEQVQALDLMSEVPAAEEPFSTFSLNVSDASFKLAKAAMERGERPSPESIRPEEFYNAFDYGDPAPAPGEPVACAMEQAAHPAFPQRNLLRVAVRTGGSGRSQSVPLNLTLLLDNSGSMERADRAEGVARAVEQLSSLLKPGDKVTVAGFSRTPRLLADRLDGANAAELNQIVDQVPAEGGTNLEQALVLGEELATRQYAAAAQNRVVLFTDGAANLGDADPESLNRRVEDLRQQGIAFDAAGFGADGLNDRLLERLTRNGNGRYYVVDDPEEADSGFADKLAGAFRPAAENVKVQVVFNPERVGRYKLIGFEEHRLKKEDFRDDTVDAAEMAAEEAGVALYQMEVLPGGSGEIGEVRVRFRDAASGRMVERSWTIPYEADAPAFDQAGEAMQLAALAAMTAEKLRDTPMAGLVDFGELSASIGRVAAKYGEDDRVAELRRMIEALR